MLGKKIIRLNKNLFRMSGHWPGQLLLKLGSCPPGLGLVKYDEIIPNLSKYLNLKMPTNGSMTWKYWDNNYGRDQEIDAFFDGILKLYRPYHPLPRQPSTKLIKYHTKILVSKPILNSVTNVYNYHALTHNH